MTRKLWSVVGAMAMVTAVTPCAWTGVIRDDRDPQLYLDLAAQAEYASVGRFDTTTNSGNYVASGTLVADNWVLTAGHVTDGAIAMQFTVAGATYNAVKWVPHPKWRGNLSSGYDIGMVELESATPVTPATRYTGKDELGAVATYVGFGMTGTGLTGATTFDGQKRAGDNVIDAYYAARGKTSRMFLSDFDNPDDPGDSAYGSATPLDLEYLTAPGDSGGAVFIDLGEGPVLAGVHSFGASFDGVTDSDYGDVSGNVRVSVFNGWIDDVISGGGGKPGKGGGKPDKPDKPDKPGKPPKDVFLGDLVAENRGATVSEPAGLGLLGLAMLRLSLLRRRRRT